ncbi:MAG: hypothetical protein M3P49_07660 [Actinomycetota bacterium]|nr:hypothetical protein [Actinomycetota bacterium]
MGFAGDRTARGVSDERGFALPTVLAVLSILALAGASYIALATQGVETSTTSDASQIAQEYAENGIEAARAQLDASPYVSLYDDDGDEWRADGGKVIRFPDGPEGVYAKVRIAYDPARSVALGTAAYGLTSTGHADGATRRLAATAVWGGS